MEHFLKINLTLFYLEQGELEPVTLFRIHRADLKTNSVSLAWSLVDIHIVQNPSMKKIS